ncbi:hypothetical protein BO83DRAFT_387670 [Aspergillus eucalypticola CBS 122712]|uniref:Uncharacterized protein n=1 Tax=Aspergillus eucalypticola (strain CBS 122712 / IBT 29274) TaxID=1448314 RepID=A0A317VMU5_ASPEC|nr:uncharacterized protein BO83DRAFT_387670 [Aspergillus eucalypticola CBS 122712]PWY75653.1 hypothetical protein BO83DRAFT_387670 [Aspergillus eucalypticola CBS 122712]
MLKVIPYSSGPDEVYGQHLQASEALACTDDLPSEQETITGIIYWETCGWYPEYWHYLKALNTIFPGCDCEDWWEYLPITIGVWPKEHAVDLIFKNSVNDPAMAFGKLVMVCSHGNESNNMIWEEREDNGFYLLLCSRSQ